MELLLRKDQKSGLMGGVKFIMEAQARLTPEEREYVSKYKMLGTVLYDEMPANMQSASTSALLVARFMKLRITVGELVEGKTIEVADILQMLAVEQQLREACEMFHRMLMAAAQFGGEEVVEFK